MSSGQLFTEYTSLLGKKQHREKETALLCYCAVPLHATIARYSFAHTHVYPSEGAEGGGLCSRYSKCILGFRSTLPASFSPLVSRPFPAVVRAEQMTCRHVDSRVFLAQSRIPFPSCELRPSW